MVFVHSVSRRRKVPASKPSSPFLALPAEVRNQIYELVLTDENPSVFNYQLYYGSKIWADGRISPKYEFLGKPRHLDFLTPHPTRLALLQTCRQIYGEAYHIYYATHTFEFAYPEDLRLFLKTIGRKRRREIVSLGLSLEDLDHERKPRFLPLLKDCINLRRLRLAIGSFYPSNGLGLEALGELRGLREVDIPSYCVNSQFRALDPIMRGLPCRDRICRWCEHDMEKLKVELEDNMTRPHERERLKSIREKSRLKDGEKQTIPKLRLSVDAASELEEPS